MDCWKKTGENREDEREKRNVKSEDVYCSVIV
jgi:hypothetical protein